MALSPRRNLCNLGAVCVAALISLLAASPARAATVFGDSTSAPSGNTSGSGVWVQFAGGSSKSYAAPINGVVTSVTAVGTGASGGSSVRILMLRRNPPSSATVVGGVNITFHNSQSVSSAARIPVRSGDALGAWTSSGATLSVAAAPDADLQEDGSITTAPADNSPVNNLGDAGDGNLAISAKIEPDADSDGYGDETQDSCPASPSVHVGSCDTDLSISADAANPASLGVGQSTLIVATASASTSDALDSHATLSIPAGLEILSASTTGGECTGSSCALGIVPAGGSRKVYVVVRATTAGTFTVGFNATSATADTNAGNNAASSTLTVTQPAQAPTSPSPTTGTTPPTTNTTQPSISLCTVPKLTGKTLEAAKAALKKAGCKTGKVSGSKKRNAKVKTQSIPRGIKVLAGTKIDLKMK